MKKKEMDRKVLSLIEEYNPESDLLTEDPDIAAKINDVTNQVMFELCRMKKLPSYTEIPVVSGQILTMEAISKACGSKVYQIDTVRGIHYAYRAGGTVLKILESGTAEIDCFVYPRRITDENAEDYEFELSEDVLEIMPYGIAADLLKSDVSSEYGAIYATRYETMKQQLDPRHHLGGIYIDGGVII